MRRSPNPGRPPSAVIVGGFLLALSACAGSAAPPAAVDPSPEQVPASLDGLWILRGSGTNLDIDLATARVDARTGCSRLLGSLTFAEGGARTSFSLPGREDSNCSVAGAAATDEVVELLQEVASAEPEPGGYRLLDADGEPVARLRSGG